MGAHFDYTVFQNGVYTYEFLQRVPGLCDLLVTGFAVLAVQLTSHVLNTRVLDLHVHRTG